MHHSIKAEKFGAFGKPMEEAVQSCVHCGFCLAACPTYSELGHESESPRGRIILMKEVLEGRLSVDEVAPHIDQCLGCLACEPACPSGVAYRELISPFRALSESERERPVLEKLRRVAIEQFLPYPRRFRALARVGIAVRFVKPLLPQALAPLFDLLPERIPEAVSLPEVTPAQGSRRARVALLAGCAQQVLDPDINQATIEVLARNGVEVVVPREQDCCGALSWHTGNLKDAQAFARRNLAAFPEDVDAIISNAAGCGSGLQEYPLILRGTADEALAISFAKKVQDVSAFLERLGDLLPVPEIGYELKVAYHDACHLSNGQGVRAEPRRLLRRIPGLRLLEIPEGHLCCGSAGTYNIEQPEIAASLGERKVKGALSVGPDLIATGNIGCLTQMKHHLEKSGRKTPVRHTIQILRDAYLGSFKH